MATTLRTFTHFPAPAHAPRRDYSYYTEEPSITRVARALGFEPMPYQRHIWAIGTEYRRDSRGRRVYHYNDVLVSTPRQSGKTTLLRPLRVYRMVINPATHLFCTAQTQKHASKRMLDMVDAVDHSIIGPLFHPRRGKRRCLWVLEGLGVITWNRGGVIDGKPTAGTFRVSKRALAALINLARPINDENTRRHRLETSKRLANLYKLCFRNRGKRLPSSDQEELGKDPHTLKGGECTHSTHRRSISPKKGKEMPAIPSISPDRLAGVHCSHGFARPDRCPQCKLNHLPPNLFAEWDAQRNNAAGGALNPAAAAEPALMGTSADPDVAQLEKQGYAGPALALAMARRKRA